MRAPKEGGAHFVSRPPAPTSAYASDCGTIQILYDCAAHYEAGSGNSDWPVSRKTGINASNAPRKSQTEIHGFCGANWPGDGTNWYREFRCAGRQEAASNAPRPI